MLTIDFPSISWKLPPVSRVRRRCMRMRLPSSDGRPEGPIDEDPDTRISVLRIAIKQSDREE